MQETVLQTQAVLRVTFTADGMRPIEGRELAEQDCPNALTDTSAVRLRQNTQCFICSRIYFDQTLSKCPHCNSESLQHYSTADLNHFARDPV